jgi:mannose-1-phosphate guanylyltransferase
MSHELWTVILAAGAGRRLAEITGGVPKQYWRSNGSRSLLGQTVDRFAPLAPPSRTVVIIDAGHRGHFETSDVSEWLENPVRQPMDRGTATGLLRALVPVLVQNPDATVVITPSDHGVGDEMAFRRGLLQAVRDVRRRDAAVLFGVEAERAHADYGWISLDTPISASGLRRVASFVEKPSLETATHLLNAGAVWNTMVIVARARALWHLYESHLPDLTAVFAPAFELDLERHEAFFDDLYPTLPSRDFSRDLLAHAPGLSVHVWPAAMGWSDLGTPDRLHAWHQRELLPVVRAMSAA